MSMLPADIHRRLEGAPVENDIEEQGFTTIASGCTRFECQEWKRGEHGVGMRLVRPALVKERGIGRGAPYYWVCPKCHGSYGEVR